MAHRQDFFNEKKMRHRQDFFDEKNAPRAKLMKENALQARFC